MDECFQFRGTTCKLRVFSDTDAHTNIKYYDCILYIALLRFEYFAIIPLIYDQRVWSERALFETEDTLNVEGMMNKCVAFNLAI